MKDFKTETEKIIRKGEGGLYSDVIDALYQLHLEGVREIIGKNEKLPRQDLEDYESKKKLTAKNIRNQLRKQQRAKLNPEVSK